VSTRRSTFIADVKSTFKRILRRPGSTLTNSVMLGSALGASVLAFAILYGYLFRPLPYNAPGQLLVLRQRLIKLGFDSPVVSIPLYRTLKKLPDFRHAGLFFNTNGGALTVNRQHKFAYIVQLTPSTLQLHRIRDTMSMCS
jgi:ABC-type Co2+ transport system permease subunit